MWEIIFCDQGKGKKPQERSQESRKVTTSQGGKGE